VPVDPGNTKGVGAKQLERGGRPCEATREGRSVVEAAYSGKGGAVKF
jgi:hypothetical protein